MCERCIRQARELAALLQTPHQRDPALSTHNGGSRRASSTRRTSRRSQQRQRARATGVTVEQQWAVDRAAVERVTGPIRTLAPWGEP